MTNDNNALSFKYKASIIGNTNNNGKKKWSIKKSEGFKRPIYWNEYKVIPNKIVGIAANNEEKYMRELLDSSWQEVKRLFVLAYNNTKGTKNIFFEELK